ncbi:hypothetical protein BC831DRAFT_514843 [Entophlyctis helioformis]|nr:hypothetical protein BC831DRAFT_514843 [Entophlyctis helioformis]
MRARYVGVTMQSKIKDFGPAAFQRYPAQLNRLVPWIRRELNALLGDGDVELVKDFIVAMLARYEPRSDLAISLLSDYLGRDAELFLHELVCFATSPFDIRAYDSVVQYHIP